MSKPRRPMIPHDNIFLGTTAGQSVLRRLAFVDPELAASILQNPFGTIPPRSTSSSSGDTTTSVSSTDLVNVPLIVRQAHEIGAYSQPYSSAPAGTMAPAAVPANVALPIGPHPSYIHVAQVYLFQQQLQSQLVAIGTNPTREDSFRLQGVQWINDVRVALHLPVRTFCTASQYYHKFRLVHKDSEYSFQDAAGAALLTACKIEDTLKKSKEILCAAHNLKVSPAEHLSPDDNAFEVSSKNVIGLERLMLEASGFDFRVRYPHKHLIKLAKEARIEKDTARLAYSMMMDLYRTFAPLKQTCATMSFACIELATLVLEKQQSAIRGERSPKYRKWGTTRTEIIETILDLLDLYTHFQKSSIVGPGQNVERFIQMRIAINKEMDESSLKRYTEHQEIRRINGHKSNVKTPKTPATPASPSDTRMNGKDVASPATLSPRSSNSGKRGVGARGQDGTVRFMLDSEQAKRERDTTAEYFKVEYEEYEVEVEEPIVVRQEREGPRAPRGMGNAHGGGTNGGGFDRGGGGGYWNKRARR